MPEKYPKEPPAFFTESISTPAEPDVTEDEQNLWLHETPKPR